MATDSIAVSKKAEATNFRQGAVVALGRLLFRGDLRDGWSQSF